MANPTNLGRTMWNVLTWASSAANSEPSTEEDAGADTDEPPEGRRSNPLNNLGATTKSFEKTTIRQTKRDQHESLLTKALHSNSEDEHFDSRPSTSFSARRRSMNSNISFASTEFTNDTGITTPARTSSPSPRLPNIGFIPIIRPIADHGGLNHRLGQSISPQTASILAGAGDQAQRAESFSDSTTVAGKKRCISFACAKPVKDATTAMPPPPRPSENVQPQRPAADVKRPCIKFTCPTQDRVPQVTKAEVKKSRPTPAPTSSPSSVRKMRSSSSQSRGPRSLTPRRPSHCPVGDRGKKFFTAEPQDLNTESSRFHAFASNEPQEDDWIRQDKSATRRKLTIDDTLKKELAIRRLGKEAEEEAEEEDNENDDIVIDVDNEDEELEDEDDEDDLDEEEEDDEDEDEDDEADEEDEDIDDDASFDGYSTDNEGGFASSDDEDDDLLLWTTREPGQAAFSGASPAYAQPSFSARSDSSIGSTRAVGQGRRKSIRFRPGTPELPDSTDFVCGTLDEDRPLEEAYLSCIAQRQREKLHIIPQDIDPSFPTSDPEDDEDEEGSYKAPRRDSVENMWHLEDLSDEHERPDRRRKKGESPKRYHSPAPPRRCHSPPPPKGRGRSPRRLFDRHSPTRRMRSPPPPQMLISPPASPILSGKGLAFKKSLAFGPAQTHTKSLPRAAGLFHHQAKAHKRSRANTVTKYDPHVRGAIDIVKGLEEKRKRRKEKFQRKYCDRARKGHIHHEKRPAPGQGAERMKELVTGKGAQNYVLSC